MKKVAEGFLPFHSQDLISNSPFCLPYNSYDISQENLGLDQPMISWLIFFFILLTYLLDIVLILLEEILSWSLVGVRGLRIFLGKKWRGVGMEI